MLWAMSNETILDSTRLDSRGEAIIRLADIVWNGILMNLSPAGIQIESRHQLIKQLTKFSLEAGFFPDF